MMASKVIFQVFHYDLCFSIKLLEALKLRMERVLGFRGSTSQSLIVSWCVWKSEKFLNSLKSLILMFSGWKKPDSHDKCVAKSCKYPKKSVCPSLLVKIQSTRWVYKTSQTFLTLLELRGRNGGNCDESFGTNSKTANSCKNFFLYRL